MPVRPWAPSIWNSEESPKQRWALRMAGREEDSPRLIPASLPHSPPPAEASLGASGAGQGESADVL